MNLCVNCKFHRKDTRHDLYSSYDVHLCGRTGYVSKVDGVRRSLDDCLSQRSWSLLGNSCGTSGKHFEAKE